MLKALGYAMKAGCKLKAECLPAEMHSVQQTGATMVLSSSRRHKRDLESLVQAIRANDNDAWVELIGRFDRMLRRIVRSYRLNVSDTDDVLQMVWLDLHQQVDHLRDPHAIGAWLVTATRRVALKALQRHVREHLTDDPELLDSIDPGQLDAELLVAERKDVLKRALGTLPHHQRRLMVLLATSPLGYREISAQLDMPMGSIGPIRARSLERLRRHPDVRDLLLA
jgi:RNA polymerase sigma factor (sigma-70 family)